jgi:hypothetical protein
MLTRDHNLTMKLAYHLEYAIASKYHLKPKRSLVSPKQLRVVMRDLPLKYNPKKPTTYIKVLQELFKLYKVYEPSFRSADLSCLWDLYYDVKGM